MFPSIAGREEILKETGIDGGWQREAVEMFSLRFLILLAIAALLVGFAIQNLTPAIALVFLGNRFPPVPLAFLLLGAIAAGFITGLVISALLRLSNWLTQRRRRRPEPQVSAPRSWQPPSAAAPDDAFDFEDKPQPPSGSSSKTYEVPPERRTGSQTGSTYSYRFREKPEPPEPKAPNPVVDAEYRVVNPGYQPPPPVEDGFGDDDDWIEDNERDDGGFR